MIEEYFQNKKLFMPCLMTCVICLNILQDPYIICQEGHNLCKNCVNSLDELLLTTILKIPTKKECPICKTVLLHRPIRNIVLYNIYKDIENHLSKYIKYKKGDIIEMSHRYFFSFDNEIPEYIEIEIIEVNYINDSFIVRPYCIGDDMIGWTRNVPFHMYEDLMYSRFEKSLNWRRPEYLEKDRKILVYWEKKWIEGIILWQDKIQEPEENKYIDYILIGIMNDKKPRDIAWYPINHKDILNIEFPINIFLSK